MKPRVRFAPSPTGPLHVGNARTALYNWLFAQREGGELLLRIEDTDPERSLGEYEQGILEDLRWLGLSWSEVWRQSERLQIYRSYAEQLLKQGKAYRCYCTPDELAEMKRLQLAKGRPPRYDGRCRRLGEAERRRLEASGRSPSLRFSVPEEGETVFEDVVFGQKVFGNADIGDFIILRSDGWPTYNFACVVDDHLMGITHVIRGEDHLPNTPRQIMLYQALGWEPPQFAHLPLLLGPDGKVLSKRHGAESVGDIRQMGILPVALANYLVLLGGRLKGDEVLGWPELIGRFSLEGISPKQSIFDLNKLLWLNRAHLRRASGEELKEALEGLLSPPPGVEVYLEALRDNASTLLDFPKLLPIFLEEVPPMGEDALSVLKEEGAREVIEVALEELERGKQGWIERLAERGLKGRQLFRPLRAALTGRVEGPELRRVIELLEEERLRARLDAALRSTGQV